ncbi:MAG TPA: EamA family transporter [Gemmatales bacterium]|nr:EamA family transporter [Gemmatales bacterium]
MPSGRLLVAGAALLWSLSGFFVKLLTEPPTWLGDLEPLAAPQIAVWRCLFGASMLLCFLQPAAIRWHPLLPWMALSFAIMNGLFIFAMAAGDVASASLLQYTAPFWVFLVNVLLLKRDQANRRDWLALLVATGGILIIVLGRWQASQLSPALMALAAGLAFAGVLLCLSFLQSLQAGWLAFVNHAIAGLLALPLAWNTPWPQGHQWVILALFGMVQTGLPYWMMSRALHSVPSHEASLITLLDPLCAPLWAYLVTYSIPSAPTWMGGAVFLLALLLRYWPGSGKISAKP